MSATSSRQSSRSRGRSVHSQHPLSQPPTPPRQPPAHKPLSAPPSISGRHGRLARSLSISSIISHSPSRHTDDSDISSSSEDLPPGDDSPEGSDSSEDEIHLITRNSKVDTASVTSRPVTPTGKAFQGLVRAFINAFTTNPAASMSSASTRYRKKEGSSMTRKIDDDGSQGDAELSGHSSKPPKRLKKVRNGATRASSDGLVNLPRGRRGGKNGGEMVLKRRSSIQTLGANAWCLIGGPTDPETTGDEGTGGAVPGQGLRLIKVTFCGPNERTEMVTLSAINTWKKLHMFFQLSDFECDPQTEEIVVMNQHREVLTEENWPPNSNVKPTRKPLQISKIHLHVAIKKQAADLTTSLVQEKPELQRQVSGEIARDIPSDRFNKPGTVTAKVVVSTPSDLPLDISVVTKDDVRIVSVQTAVHYNDLEDLVKQRWTTWCVENDEDYVFPIVDHAEKSIPGSEVEPGVLAYHELKMVYVQARVTVPPQDGMLLPSMTVALADFEDTIRELFSLLEFPSGGAFARHHYAQLCSTGAKYVRVNAAPEFGTIFSPSVTLDERWRTENMPALLPVEYRRLFMYFAPVSEEISAQPKPTLSSEDFESWIDKLERYTGERDRCPDTTEEGVVVRVYSFAGTVLNQDEAPSDGEDSPHRRSAGHNRRRSGDGYNSGSNYDTDGSAAAVPVWTCCNPKKQEDHEAVALSTEKQICHKCQHRMCERCEVCGGRPTKVRGKKEPKIVPNMHPIHAPENAMHLLNPS